MRRPRIALWIKWNARRREWCPWWLWLWAVRRVDRWHEWNKPGVEGSLADLARDIYEHSVRPHQKNRHRAVIGLEVGGGAQAYLIIDGARYGFDFCDVSGPGAFAHLADQIFDKLWHVFVEGTTLTGKLHR